MRGVLADGERLKSLRHSRGLTQDALAALAQCDAKTVRKAEQGRNMDASVLGRLAAALDVRFSDVVVGIDGADEEVTTLRRVAEAWLEAFNRRDLDQLLTYFHPKAVVRAPGAPDIPFGGEFRGLEQIRHMHEAAFQTASTEPLTPEMYSLHAVNDRVFLHGEANMTSAETGATARLWAMHMLRFEQGQIIEMVISYDALAVHRVLKGGEPLNP